jgi:hypothetical protein
MIPCDDTSRLSRGDPMPIERLREPPRSTTLTEEGAETLYAVTLTAVPSPAWRAAFLQPPPRLTRPTATPELGRVGLDGARVLFRTTSPRLDYWLRWVDRWIAYANTVVEE